MHNLTGQLQTIDCFPGTGTERAPGAVWLFALPVLGAVLRLAVYASGPSLWVDEARLALNIGSHSYAGLLGALDYDQVAPPLFLWILKLASQIGGMTEHSLRAFPLIAGICVPFIAVAVAARLAGRRVAVVAGVLTALSPGLVSQTTQAKPYITDALVALLLIAVYLRGSRPARLSAGMVVCGVVAIWLSAPSIFVLAAIAVATVMVQRSERGTTQLAPIIAWAASFGAAYLVAYRHGSANHYLRLYWEPKLLRVLEPGVFARIGSSLQDILLEGFSIGIMERPRFPFIVGAQYLWAVALAACTALGGWHLWRRVGPPSAVLILGPAMMAIAAAALGLYPLAPRLMLFWLPSLAVLLAVGLVALERTSSPVRFVGVGAVASALFAAGLWCVELIAARGEEVRPVVQRFRARAKAGEPIYIFARALPAWAFYTTDWNRPDTERLARMAREGSSGGLAFENAPSRGRPVNNDGARLRFAYCSWTELLGVFSGASWRPDRLPSARPDTDWAVSEARRIQKEANPGAWVLLVESRGIDNQLQLAIEHVGGELREEFRQGDVRLVRYEWVQAAARAP